MHQSSDAQHWGREAGEAGDGMERASVDTTITRITMAVVSTTRPPLCVCLWCMDGCVWWMNCSWCLVYALLAALGVYGMWCVDAVHGCLHLHACEGKRPVHDEENTCIILILKRMHVIFRWHGRIGHDIRPTPAICWVGVGANVGYVYLYVYSISVSI